MWTVVGASATVDGDFYFVRVHLLNALCFESTVNPGLNLSNPLMGKNIQTLALF